MTTSVFTLRYLLLDTFTYIKRFPPNGGRDAWSLPIPPKFFILYILFILCILPIICILPIFTFTNPQQFALLDAFSLGSTHKFTNFKQFVLYTGIDGGLQTGKFNKQKKPPFRTASSWLFKEQGKVPRLILLRRGFDAYALLFRFFLWWHQSQFGND